MDEKTNVAAAEDTAALKNRIAELEAALKEKNAIPGVPEALTADVKRRVSEGLPLHHAIVAAKSQAENDARLAAEEKATKSKKKD
jgi:hypothetical protein